MNKTRSVSEVIESTLNTWVCAPISVFGVITCSISILIFSSKEFKSEKLFDFYRLKAILNFFNLFIKTFLPTYYYGPEPKQLWQVIYSIYFKSYFSSSLEASSMIISILAVLFFYSKFSDKKKILNFLIKINIYMLSISLFVLFCGVFSFKLVEKDIKMKRVNLSKNLTTISYYFEQSYFSTTLTYKILEITIFLIRDFVFLLILIVLNLILYLNLRTKLKEKRSF